MTEGYKTLPPNCEIDWVDLDEGVFRLVFWGEYPYYSEVLKACKDEYAHDVGCEYIERMGWDKKWPNMSVDTDALLDELESIAEEAIGLIEENPGPFGHTWEDCLEWLTPDMNGRIGDDIDVEMYPYLDDGEWVETEDSFVYVVDNGKLIEIEHSIYDGSNWETEACFEGPQDNDELALATALASCNYHCLKCDLYNIYVARIGDDPLGNIYPVQREEKGVCTVAVTDSGFEFSNRFGRHISAEAKHEIRLFLGESLKQLRGDLEEIGAEAGKINTATGCPVHSWSLVENSDTKVVVKVQYCMQLNVPDQTSHNKEVAMRRLEASVRSGHQYVVDAIAKHKAKETSNG
jgi:hypothetical protein